jgi:hypothetical protein
MMIIDSPIEDTTFAKMISGTQTNTFKSNNNDDVIMTDNNEIKNDIYSFVKDNKNTLNIKKLAKSSKKAFYVYYALKVI